jgi:hypothetical protein
MKKHAFVLARLLVLAISLNIVLAACGNSEDTPLSDEDKISRSRSGRESYIKGMQGTAGTAGATKGK